MEDRDIYITIMADETAKKYLETDNYKRLYRYLKQRDSSITFGELTTFLRNADIDIFAAGVVPLEAFKGDRTSLRLKPLRHQPLKVVALDKLS